VGPPATLDGPSTGPSIVAVYPNPALANDRGEFVVVDLPSGADRAGLALTDGETTLAIPAGAAARRVAVATDPAARNLTEVPVVVAEGQLHLSNAGERVALVDADGVLDAVTYPRAPEGSVYRRTRSGWTWRHLGATAFPVRTSRNATARVFVLPDAPGAALAPFRTAERRLWLGGYTLTSARVVHALCAAQGRGVDVRVLVERTPVGGMTATEAASLDRLARCRVAVRVIGGPDARYAFHHAKYAVVDDRVVVLTENWKPSGVGGRSSRGWGAVVDSPGVADALAATFTADAGWRDARPWLAVRAGRTFDRTEPAANGTYPEAFTPTTVPGATVEVVVAPDDAESRVVSLLDGAGSSIRVIQVSVGGPGQPFVRALVRAARRGVSVRLLLAGVWYVRDHNRQVATTLRSLARRESLPLDVRLASPRGRFGKIHAKGAVVDDDAVLLGSLNWNNNSARRNREVDVVIHSRTAGRYYASVFDADWQGGRWRVPAGLLAVGAVVATLAGAVGSRSMRFDPTADEGVRPGPERVSDVTRSRRELTEEPGGLGGRR